MMVEDPCQTSNKHHHHGGAVCPRCGADLIEKPAPSWGDLCKGLTEAGVEGVIN